MIEPNQLKEVLDLLHKARCNLNYDNYVTIWGEHLGKHIWRQEGSDLIRIWKSGLTPIQADKFIHFILDNFVDEVEDTLFGMKVKTDSKLKNNEFRLEGK